jgi:hypothetical protein
VLIVRKNQKLKIRFLFVESGKVYDPTSLSTPSDVTISVVRGSSQFGGIILSPLSYLYTAASPDPLVYIEKSSNSEFVFNYTVPEGAFPGIYTVVAKTLKDDVQLVIESRFEIKEDSFSPLPTVPLGNRSSVVTYKPSYEDISSSNMQSILLIGHADGIELNSPIKIRSLQHATELLNGNISSPLLRGAFDAYHAGARSIFICAAAPMSEYVASVSNRLTSVNYFNLDQATPNYQNFYEKYYERLETTYSIIKELDFIDIVVPLEASFIGTGETDFLTQLVDYCGDFHNETSFVQIGVIGSRTEGLNSEDISIMLANSNLVNKYTIYNPDGTVASDKGRYVVPIYGEAVFSHAEIQDNYVSSVAAAVAAVIANNPLNMGMIRKRVPGALSLYGASFTTTQINQLESIGMNVIYRSNKARRGNLYEVYISNDYTLAKSSSIFSKLPQMRLASFVASKIKGFGYDTIGKLGYNKLLTSVSEMLTDMKADNIIVDFEFSAQPSRTEQGVITLNINMISSLGLKKVNLSLSAGPGA